MTPALTALVAHHPQLTVTCLLLVPRTAIDPTTPGIRTAPIEDHPILRLLFAVTRRTETANPTTTAVITALRTAARQARTTPLRPEADPAQLEVRVHA
ncbi:hypothetical protein ABZX98_06705 [Streptomyces sp. NPDC002992]|uniref:hypothetical protein n=1 Tax=Streptomyces sp. NPDC002992 TaxID=3154273 RepID=UPI0033B2561A